MRARVPVSGLPPAPGFWHSVYNILPYRRAPQKRVKVIMPCRSKIYAMRSNAPGKALAFPQKRMYNTYICDAERVRNTYSALHLKQTPRFKRGTRRLA